MMTTRDLSLRMATVDVCECFPFHFTCSDEGDDGDKGGPSVAEHVMSAPAARFTTAELVQSSAHASKRWIEVGHLFQINAMLISDHRLAAALEILCFRCSKPTGAPEAKC